VSVNGTEIVYTDASPGLPVNYYNGENTYIFAWNSLGQLHGGMVNNKAIMYEYNSDGLRTFRRGGSNSYNYYYDGDRLIAQKWGGNKYILFHYDESDSIYAITYYNGTTAEKYNLFKNLQGDVVEVRSKYNALLASYNYDPWGNVVSVTDSSGNEITDTTHIAHINPIRYRSYYYDDETGLYYVSSRYYDPEIGRWINADSQLNTSLGVLGLNLFSYCLNNPVNMVDYGGNKPGDLFDTMDEAARDFAEYINETSIEVDREYASYIYTKTVWKTKTVTYYNPNLFGNNLLSRFWNYIFGGGISKTVKKRVQVTKYTYVKPAKGTAHSSTIPINWFGMHNQVALLHTHGAYSPGYGNDVFSSKDKELANKKNMPTYVATPLGTLRKYNPSNDTDIVLYDDLPFDPNHPGR